MGVVVLSKVATIVSESLMNEVNVIHCLLGPLHLYTWTLPQGSWQLFLIYLIILSEQLVYLEGVIEKDDD